MKREFLYALTAGLLTAGVIKATPAAAEPAAPGELNVSVVRTGDLNLAGKAGQRQLDLRLIHAAREVCGTASDFDLQGKQAARECREQTLAQARAQRDRLLADARLGTHIAVTAAR